MWKKKGYFFHITRRAKGFRTLQFSLSPQKVDVRGGQDQNFFSLWLWGYFGYLSPDAVVYFTMVTLGDDRVTTVSEGRFRLLMRPNAYYQYWCRFKKIYPIILLVSACKPLSSWLSWKIPEILHFFNFFYRFGGWKSTTQSLNVDFKGLNGAVEPLIKHMSEITQFCFT